VTADYIRVAGPADLFAKARELSVRTMILDVEPLVTPWRSSQESLDQGIARILGRIRTVPSVRVVVFTTNSARHPSAVPSFAGIEVRYLASAQKPLRTAPFQALPRPGAVAGDQLPTDGILAYRLRFTFLHYVAQLADVPPGPELMHQWGQLVRPLLFRPLPPSSAGFLRHHRPVRARPAEALPGAAYAGLANPCGNNRHEAGPDRAGTQGR
jgi:predicted HAD superfamily phosphohydrolase YqeG